MSGVRRFEACAAPLLVAVVLAFAAGVDAQKTILVEVAVSDASGAPLAGATVAVFDIRTISTALVGRVGEDGRLEARVPAGGYYIIYMFKIDESGRLTHVPAYVDLTGYGGYDGVRVRGVLYPAARINVTGRIIYLGGRPASYKVQILSRDGRPLSSALEVGDAVVVAAGGETRARVMVVDVYGPTRDYAFIKRIFGAELLKMNEALAPVGVEVRARLNYTVVTQDYFLREVSVDFGSIENPLFFRSPAETMVIDLLRTSLSGQISIVKQDVGRAREMIQAYEAMGFYIPDIHDLLRAAEGFVGEGERLFSSGAAPEAVLASLERAYVIANDQIPKRLGFLRDVSRTGGIVMPSFLAVFAAVLSFYFADSDKYKMLMFSVVYAALATAFVLVYPGFSLLWSLSQTLFLGTVAGAYIVFFAVVFLLPRVIREPELPGEVALGGLVAVAFSMGKRYSKLRVFRTVVTIFSIAAFIWAFTVLASFGTVYAKIEERGFATSQFDIFTVKRIGDSTPMPLNIELDPLLLANRSEVRGLYVRVLNRPDISLTVSVSRGGLGSVLHFALGLDPRELEVNSRLGQCITTVASLGDDGVILPYTVWSSLGLRGGETLNLIIEAEGYGAERVSARAAGFFREDALAEARDPDGLPVLPFILRDGRPVYANASDVIIASASTLLKMLKPPEGGDYSGVFMPYALVSQPTSREGGFAVASDIVDRRGENYVAVSCYGGECDRVHFGTRVESVFERDITFVVPLVIVIFNVLLTMFSIVRERRREIFIFMTVGFNPRHIALVFLAEAIIYGLLSGGFGYVTGLATFRVLSRFAQTQNLMIREKLEWYWSYVAIALAVLVAILGAIRPSMEAAFMYAPTEVRRVKVRERKEVIKREERYLRTVAMKTFSIPGEIRADEGEIAFAYIQSRLTDLSYGELERVEGLTDYPFEERPDGTRIKRFTFNYLSTTEDGVQVAIDCELRFVNEPGSERYHVELNTKPIGEAPISHMDYAADLVKRLISDWMTERERLI